MDEKVPSGSSSSSSSSYGAARTGLYIVDGGEEGARDGEERCDGIVGEVVEEREGDGESKEPDVATPGLALPRLRRGRAEAEWIMRCLRNAGERAECGGRLASGEVATEPSFGSDVWSKSQRLFSKPSSANDRVDRPSREREPRTTEASPVGHSLASARLPLRDGRERRGALLPHEERQEGRRGTRCDLHRTRDDRQLGRARYRTARSVGALASVR